MLYKGCLPVLLAVICLVTAHVMILPKDVNHLLESVHDLESFLKAFNISDITTIVDRPVITASGRPALDSSSGGKHPKGVVPLYLEDAKCKPYPTIVEVPYTDQDKFYYRHPYYVELQQCAGSCGGQQLYKTCEPTESQSITVLAFVMKWHSSGKFKPSPRYINMLNHTKCDCGCIAKPSACNPVIQRFSEDNCRCECKSLNKKCPKNQIWHPIDCKCV